MSDGKTLMEILAPGLSVIATDKTAAGCLTWTDEQWAEHDARIAVREGADRKADLDKDRASLIANMEREGWPRRALEAALVADETRAAISRLRDADTRERNIVVLGGRPGCGKTVAAAWWGIRRVEASASSSFRRPPPVFVRSSTFSTASRYSDRDQRRHWLSAGAMVLDDIGTEYADQKGSLLADLDELIDTFYGSKRPLIITTNIAPKDFRGRYGDRISDRLRECGRWINCDSESMRGAQ